MRERKFTDAEFEVVSGPRRIGDPHPYRSRWLFAGVDGRGRPMWYRPPRLNRWQFFLALCGLVAAGWLALAVAFWAFHQLRPY